jgi:hypothetical protein
MAIYNEDDALDNFLQAESFLAGQRAYEPPAGGTGHRAIFEWVSVPGTERMPMTIRTGKASLGQPHERKEFICLEFHGRGTVSGQIFVDDYLVLEFAGVTATEQPSLDRVVNLPVNTYGYDIDVEFVGNYDPRCIEVTIRSLPRGS